MTFLLNERGMRRRGAATRRESAAGIALWRQIADDIERAIAVGTYKPGARLPGETALADRLGVNRHTVRRAIAALSERGLVRAERGSGTFVETRRMAYPIGSRTRFSEIVGADGREPGGRLIASAVEPAAEEIARRLRVKPGAAVARLDLIRHADRVPICVATTWLPAARFPSIARVYAARRSMTAALASFGVADYRRASTRIVAALADAADAQRLDLRPGSPILIADSVDVDANGAPALTTRARFAAERVSFVVER